MPDIGTERAEGDDAQLATTQWVQEMAHFVNAGNQNSPQVVGRALGWCGVGRAKTRAGRSAPPRRAAEESAAALELTTPTGAPAAGGKRDRQGAPLIYHHAPCVARGADTTALAGEGDKVVVTTIVTPRPGKAVRKDAAFQIFAKGLADIRLGGAVVALAVELACAGQVKPGLEVFGYRLVQQRALGMARVVEFGFAV